MRIYVNGGEVDALHVRLRSSDEVIILQALSGAEPAVEAQAR